MITHRTVEVSGLKVFVREAGDRNAPAIVLLHGFPSSSHMFRDLMPLLADRFRVIAPDMIGFGHSDAPSVDRFEYSFENLARLTRQVLDRLEVRSYVLYLQDYGGPIGFRIAVSAPERVRGLVVQNANAYVEGISQAVADLFLPLWKERNEKTLGRARGFLTADATKMQYTAGARRAASLNPDAWTLDQALLDRPGVAEAQLELFVDYEKNVASYDAWHAYLRDWQPRTLVVWGKNDPFFLQAGAEAYRGDVPAAEIVLLDGGHFVLEEYAPTIAALISRTFGAVDNEEAVRTFYRELAAGRLDDALGVLAEDASWNDPKGFPYGGRLTGASEVKKRVFEPIGAEWAAFTVELTRIVASSDGQTFVALGRYVGRNRATSRTLDTPFVHVWSTAGGKVTRFETFTDTVAMRDAMTL